MNTKRLTTLAMLVAIYLVLSILTPVKIANFKFTFEAFPILIAGLLMGPIDGLIVGGVGSFIYQLLFSGYGITPTTPLWILPHALSGLLVGVFSQKSGFELDFKKLAFICVISAFTVTLLNILALYVDSKLYGYYSKALVFGNIFIKIIVGVILSIIYASILPKLLAYLKKQLNRQA
ncbi:MAG: folate family ECF transporter S component [Erysipelotrichaceae bacterium]|nr:folate family ECF transporter S component [Erysipelotrichaceae bacterium]